MSVVASVELGGTKVVCGIGSVQGELAEAVVIPTAAPAETIDRAVTILEELQRSHGRVGALGIAAFGPLTIDPRDSAYGQIGRTPKPGWSGVNLLQAFARLQTPLTLGTDVGMAALAEARLGAGRGGRVVVYLTVGTGIGGAAHLAAGAIEGRGHPELGHIRAPRAPGDAYPGGCPFHGDCIEGMAAGPHIMARWGKSLDHLEPDHEGFQTIAHYLGHLVADVILTIAPDRVVLGGGVGSQARLLPFVRAKVRALNNGYLPHLVDSPTIERLIVGAALPHAGLIGGLLAAGDLAAGAAVTQMPIKE